MDTNEGSECSFKSGESQEKDIPSASQEGAKKEVPPSMQKICLVCGDKALGYNFNVISCESCKAFFRRNALTTKEFKCPFTNNCEITVVTRRFCQKCRLVKCLAVGMVKEFIMSDEDKAEKRRKIEENRAKKRQSTEPDDGVSSSKSYKHESELSTVGYPPPMQDVPVVQYNMLNSTTCSPNSSVQSPLNPETDNSIPSIHSPPVYSQYAPIHSSEIPYTIKLYPMDDKTSPNRTLIDQRFVESYNMYDSMDGNTNSNSQSQNKVRLYPIDEKMVLNRALIEQRTAEQYGISNNLDSNMNFESQKQDILNMKIYPMDEKSVTNKALIEQRMEPFNIGDSVDSNMYSNSPKNTISIRSLLTNGNGSVYREPQHLCEEIPSTSTDPNVNKARDILQDVERIEPNSMESILCEAIKLEFEAFSSVNSCVGSSRELNEVERAKMNELIVANKALNAPIDDAMSQLIGDIKQGDGKHDPRLITIVNLTAVAIRRFIKMAKKINAFKNMCEEDQVALLKGGCIEMMILRSTMTYDGQKNQWKLPHNQEQFGSIRTDVLKLAKGNIYLSHDSFIKTFDLRWRTDENIILVMSAILLFTPTRPKVVHRDVIKLEQNSYYYLLRRYLESIYPGCEAKSTFLKLIQKIMELRKLAEEVTGVYLDVNPIEPLLMEIFDLKHHAA